MTYDHFFNPNMYRHKIVWQPWSSPPKNILLGAAELEVLSSSLGTPGFEPATKHYSIITMLRNTVYTVYAFFFIETVGGGEGDRIDTGEKDGIRSAANKET